MRAAWILSVTIIATLLTGGCPDGAAVVDTGATEGDPSGGSTTTTGGSEGGTTGEGGTPGVAAKTGILVSTPAGSVTGLYDVYDATGTTQLEAAFGTGEVEELPAGTYVLKRYFSDSFVFATGVTVVAGGVTEVPFGAVNVVTVAGSNEATYDIWDAAGTTLLTRAQSDNTILPLPPGSYVLKEYFNDSFVWASSVQVIAGQVTTVSLGAFELRMGADWESPSYDVYAADGVTLLSRPKSANQLVPLPAASYAIFDYFNGAFRYANVTVAAGQVTTFEMGAILYTGSESSYDIYDASGTVLLDRPASRGTPRAVPPGTYVLKDYFSDVVLAAGVSVSAGAVTTVP